MSRFGRASFRPGSFRSESIRPWVVSANFGESFRPDLILIYYIIYFMLDVCVLYEASLPYSQSCKGTWFYYRVKNLHLYSIKTIGVMDYKTKKAQTV